MKPNEVKKGARFASNIQVGGAGLDTAGLRSLAESNPEGFMARMQKLIDDGLRWSDVTDLRGLYNALSEVQVEARVNLHGQVRAVMSSAFPLLSGALTVAGINDAFIAVPTVGQELVREVDDNKKSSRYASLTSMDTEIDKVEEGKPFPEILAGEESFEVRNKRNGRRISITAETIDENDVAGFVQKINALSEIAAELIEEQTLERVTDVHGSGSSPAEPYVLRPDGAGAALYSTTANNPGTRAPSGTRINNNALVDGTDLDNARTVLAAMRNYRGRRISIPVSRTQLLVPDAKVGVALKIANSRLEPGVENEINNWGPEGAYRPKIVSSPKLDDISTSAWYLGDFKKQFVRKWKLRLEMVSLEGNTQAYLESRIAFQARIAWDCEIGATDYVYVVQSLSGTTAPSLS